MAIVNNVPKGVKPPASAEQRLTKEQLRKLLVACDINGDGVLTRQEIKKAFERVKAFWPDYRAWRGIANADHNGDGLVSMDDELDGLIDYVYNLRYTTNNMIRN